MQKKVRGVDNMKKNLKYIAVFILCLAIPLTAFAASVVPVKLPGNDANPSQYTPPPDCIRTTLPDSDKVGTHVYSFDSEGNLDSAGTNVFTLVVGTVSPDTFTQALSWSWSGSYPLYGVIMKGGPNFNLYVYNGTATSDTNLVCPTVSSGKPAAISHVSVILCPNGTPPVPPDGNIVCFILIGLFIVIVLAIMLFCFRFRTSCCRH